MYFLGRGAAFISCVNITRYNRKDFRASKSHLSDFSKHI